MTRPTHISLAQAVAEFTRDGDSIYLGNFGAQLFAVGHELIRQRRCGLHAIVPSGGILLDQLIGAGALASATFAHCWSPVGPAPAWNFRRLRESGGAGIGWHEMSLGALVVALTAGAWGVPFMPLRDPGPTSYRTEALHGGMWGEASSTFGDAPVVRALLPDVAFMHADMADGWGNARVVGPLADTTVACQAARRVVLVVEELVDEAVLRASCANVAGVTVSGVVHLPGALRPDGAVGRYDRDVEAYERYATAAATLEGFHAWLEQHVLNGAVTGGRR